ncbi:OsmC family protein [Anaeromyxobacter dehalogenans]|uniref:OsmC family protein n=1 Tax=Anaeromyxobacter dehalogenans TaxID=161493 RepID=UPI00247AFB43|nr:OsmC family protein [Anaeromyxobacter dehalogenans]
MGTFGGALEARHIPATDDRLTVTVTGEVELEGKVLVIRRIHARLELRATPEHAATAQRVHGFYHEACPVYRSLSPAIAITSELVLLPETA